MCVLGSHVLTGDFFCMEAFLERHGHGHRQQHTYLQLDRAGNLHRFGELLSAEEDGSKKPIEVMNQKSFFKGFQGAELESKTEWGMSVYLVLSAIICIELLACVFASILQASRLLRRAKFAREGGAWLAFQDDQLTTYWYHLCDKVATFANPYFGSVHRMGEPS